MTRERMAFCRSKYQLVLMRVAWLDMAGVLVITEHIQTENRLSSVKTKSGNLGYGCHCFGHAHCVHSTSG